MSVQDPKAGPMTEDEKDFFKELGARLSTLRQTCGLTQAQVAERIGVSQQTVNSFERGRRRVPVSQLTPLAKLLGVSVEELIDDKAAAKATKRGPASRLERQIEQIRRLPKAKQKFVSEMLESVISRSAQDRAS